MTDTTDSGKYWNAHKRQVEKEKKKKKEKNPLLIVYMFAGISAPSRFLVGWGGVGWDCSMSSHAADPGSDLRRCGDTSI